MWPNRVVIAILLLIGGCIAFTTPSIGRGGVQLKLGAEMDDRRKTGIIASSKLMQNARGKVYAEAKATKGEKAMAVPTAIKIGGGRQVVPGDYVVHEGYGIGRFKGIERVNLTPTREKCTFEPLVVVEYSDTEIRWYKRVAEKELWLYRSADSGTHELSSIMQNRKWLRHKEAVGKSTRKGAVNLMRLMAMRNSFHRLPCAKDDEEYRIFEESFAFSPTLDQQECFDNVRTDMVDMTRPMDRLICGDVGFGKTEVAMRAIFRAVKANRQVAFLAPTRVLALQHLRVLKSRFPDDVSIALLRGGNSAEKVRLKESMATGVTQVVVGTHALLQPDVKFKNLGLLVVDEEQRFGVGHKEKLKLIQSGIDVLTLSATPIPRTLQISLSGLRDLSLMNSPPTGRKEVKVRVGPDLDSTIVNAIEQERARSGQVFVVVPFVKDVAPTTNRLLHRIPGLRVIEAHGRHTDLEDRIDRFSSREADVLVATTVIENGIDMPNVNTIVVLQADRFGISALYQLRGRVGRSKTQAYAYFLKTANKEITIEAETRLIYLETFTALGSGYDLSRRDMEMRGYGTIFGAEQSGSKDVGIDLQTELLKATLEELQERLFLPVQVTRVDLGTDIELLGTTLLGALPSHTDVAALLQWEKMLAAVVIKQAFPGSESSLLHEQKAFDEVASAQEVAELLKKWMAVIPDEQAPSVGPRLFEIAKRKLLSFTCMLLGVQEVYQNEEGRIVLSFESYLAKEKWKKVCSYDGSVDKLFRHHPDGYLETMHPIKDIRVTSNTLISAVSKLEQHASKMMREVLENSLNEEDVET